MKETQYIESQLPVDLKTASIDELKAAKTELEISIESIKSQIEDHYLAHNAGEPTKSIDWFRKAKHSLSIKKQQKCLIDRRISEVKQERKAQFQESFLRSFYDQAKVVLPEEVFVKLHQSAMEYTHLRKAS